MDSKQLSIEKRIIKFMFEGSLEELDYLLALIRKSEKEFDFDIISEILSIVTSTDSFDSKRVEITDLESLIRLTINIYADLYLEKKYNIQREGNEDFFSFITMELDQCDLLNFNTKLVLDPSGYRTDYEFCLDFWDEFVEAIDLFRKK